MSLIACPECNKEISDKVKACPHCGFPFEDSDTLRNELQKVEITSVNIKTGDSGKLKKILFGIAGILLVITIIFVSLKLLNDKKEKEAYNSYIDNLTLAMDTMLDGGSEAEAQCNLTVNVWRNSIYEERDPKTDKFTMSGGTFYSDFNTALGKLFSDISTKERILDIEENRVSVELIVKSLQNPPEGLEKCYESVTDLYTTYLGLTDLAINPSGSLQTFSESKSTKVDQFLEVYNRLKAQIPSKK